MIGGLLREGEGARGDQVSVSIIVVGVEVGVEVTRVSDPVSEDV